MNGNDFEYTDYYNGVETDYSESGDYYYESDYAEDFDDYGYEAAEVPNDPGEAGGEERRRYRRRRPKGVSPAHLRRLQHQLNGLKKQIAQLKRMSAAGGGSLGGKLKKLEERLDQMKQNDLLYTLMGYPQVESIQFEGDESPKAVKDVDYKLPLIKLLMDGDSNLLGGKGGGSNQLLQFMILSELSGSGNGLAGAGSRNQWLPLLLLTGNNNR